MRYFFTSLILLISLLARADEARPNVILCMTDDQGWGDVSYNGLTKIQTPNMDAMAAAGLRFNRFYAQQTCSPTWAGARHFSTHSAAASAKTARSIQPRRRSLSRAAWAFP